ncbi:hypothetical protein N200_01845 [Helicobacter pylori UM065]|nr:hypothetical protein N200_01845 [Helicobacter pylori UM065]
MIFWWIFHLILMPKIMQNSYQVLYILIPSNKEEFIKKGLAC